MNELYRKYRPTTLAQVVGQPAAIKQLDGYLKANKVPASILFSGSPGVGKTTIARILAKAVGASEMNITELNAAQNRGIDEIREIQTNSQLRPMCGTAKVTVIDEAQALTAAAWSAMLKMLEDVPAQTYYFLCTSNPEKIPKAIQTRLSKVVLNDLPAKVLVDLLLDVAKKEAIGVDTGAVEAIAKAAQGSARTALVSLDTYRHSGFDKEVLEKLTTKEEVPENIFNLCRLLVSGSGSWSAVYALASSVEADGIEGIRHMILNYAGSCLKDQKQAPRALAVIRCFHAPFFDSKKPGFLAACYSSFVYSVKT